jgi:hypothetical protein
MKLSSRSVAFVLFSALAITLSGCTSTGTAPEATETPEKQAGALGSRICFVNESSVPMSVAPSGRIVPENNRHFVGNAGPLSANSELCFAGWNSRESDDFKSNKLATVPTYFRADVVVALSVDGRYNALTFYAQNDSIKPCKISWNENPGVNHWVGETPSVDNSITTSAIGQNFTVTRRGDSEYYKEFLVRFTR